MTFRVPGWFQCLGVMTGMVMACQPAVALAELDASVYSGFSRSQASDVTLSQPADNTQLVFHEINWNDKSQEQPLYWGLRLTYWFPSSAHWGLALDFTHAKIHADLGQGVRVTGTRQGSAVNATESLATSFNELAMSHGFNYLTVNAVYRWQARPRLKPFVGFGGGLMYPHVEVETGSSYTDEYQLAGWTLAGMLGFNYDLNRAFALFAEYRLSYADIQADLSGGGELRTAVWTQHLNLGVTYHFDQ